MPKMKKNKSTSPNFNGRIFDLPHNVQLRIWKKLTVSERISLAAANHMECDLPNCQKHRCERNHAVRNILSWTQPIERPMHFCPICQLILLIRDFGGPVPHLNFWRASNYRQYKNYQPMKLPLLFVADQPGQMR